MKGKHMKLGRWIAFFLTLVVSGLVTMVAMRGGVVAKPVIVVSGYEPWGEEIIAEAGGIPVQSGGRVKPFSTWAGFTMLKLHGSRTMRVQFEDGSKYRLSPTEWVLDCLFRPEFASKLPTFRIDNSEILENLNVESKGRRDRYSYAELEGGLDKLSNLAVSIRKKEEKFGGGSLSYEESQLLQLDERINLFLSLNYCLSFAREKVQVEGEVPSVEPGKEKRYSTWVRLMPVFGQILRNNEEFAGKLPEGLDEIYAQIELNTNRARGGVTWLPPHGEAVREWKPLGVQLVETLEGKSGDWEKTLKDIEMVEDMVIALEQGEGAELGEGGGFIKPLRAFRAEVEKRAKLRNEGGKVGAEIIYYQTNAFLWALVFSLLAFLVSAFGWMAPSSSWGKLCYFGTWVGVVFSLIAIGGGIGQRCYIMERPPVGNLYDTIPFITFVAVFILVLAEVVTRRQVLIGLAAALGVIGLFLARRFEVGEAKDHMDPLVAVLRSNFWLSTHVVTVTMGYAGGLVTAGLSHIYLYGRLFGLDTATSRRFLTRVVYGMVCFTLFFSLIGTVLGGIWANDSWGRFWGWDPKENGALMIVLWNLAILHARVGGIIREWGLHLAAIFGAILVGFSWWGVNMLGHGLHSYGHMDGQQWVYIFYLFEFLVLLAGFFIRGYSKPSDSG